MGEKPACPHCGKLCADENGLYSHMKAKHRGPAKQGKPKRPVSEQEQSIGEELAEALADYAGGIEPPDYLLAMFPEQFEQARPSRREEG